MPEIRFEDLDLSQKLGMALCADLRVDMENGNISYALDLIRRHALGGVWVTPFLKDREETIRRVKEAADYPILIFCDSEMGRDETRIPQVLSLTASGAKDEYAYAFGRAVACQHRKMGYNVVCDPLLDICKENLPCGASTRTFGPDKHTVTRLGAALARGMHAGGTLTVAKHYPGTDGMPYDSHMRESVCHQTREELLEENLYPYTKLDAEGLLDGIMTGHKKVPSIDPDHPASLSRGVLDVLRDTGFKGFYITDALDMMGVVLKYGRKTPFGLSVHAGNMALGWAQTTKEDYDSMAQCFEEGLFSEADLDDVVRTVLDAQHKVTLLPETDGVLPEDAEIIRRINRECVSAVCDEGLSPAIDPDSRHLFVIMTYDNTKLDTDTNYTPAPRAWFYPQRIADRLRALFPNSGVTTHPYSPTGQDNFAFFHLQEKYDDLVFITHYISAAFEGREHLSTHFVDLMDALQSTDRIIAHLHFGSPHVAADAPHMPRVLMGLASEACVMHTLDILHGDAGAVGHMPYDLQFHKKGDLFW